MSLFTPKVPPGHSSLSACFDRSLRSFDLEAKKKAIWSNVWVKQTILRVRPYMTHFASLTLQLDFRSLAYFAFLCLKICTCKTKTLHVDCLCFPSTLGIFHFHFLSASGHSQCYFADIDNTWMDFSCIFQADNNNTNSSFLITCGTLSSVMNEPLDYLPSLYDLVYVACYS